MRRVALFLTALFAINLFLTPAQSAVKAGQKCTKQGATSIVSGKKYTCIKSGNKLVWNKGVAVPKPVASPNPVSTDIPTPAVPIASPSPSASIINIYNPLTDGFLSPCELDPLTPPQWLEMQNYFKDYKHCQGAYRLVKVEMPIEKPTTKLTTELGTKNLDMCKLKSDSLNNRGQVFPGPNNTNHWTRFRFPAPKMVIQVIPIFAPDTSISKKTPSEDYGKYFDFLKEWIDYSSDNGSNVVIKIPNKYFEFSSKLKPFGVTHEKNHTENQEFAKKLIQEVDPFIDFTGVNMSLVLVPPGTSNDVFFQANLGELITNEGFSGKIAALPPETYRPDSMLKHFGVLQPIWMIHELFHVGIGFDDRYGNSNFFNNMIAGNFEDSGLGGLTLMSTSRSDLSAWEKWLIGFVSDNQIICASSNETTYSWISPSTFKTTNKKLLVVPISETKVIAVESIRLAGLSYKLNKKSVGAFVYVIDSMATEHGRGMTGLYPNGRSATLHSHERIYFEDAPLKLGEFLIYEGFRISVVETGDFGDVVKVEKI